MDGKVLDLEDLQQYLVLGIDGEGKHVTAQSSNLTIPDAEAMIARLQSSLDIMKVAAGVAQAQGGTAPGPKLWTPEG